MNPRAFSLVELLAVVAIMTILGALLFPTIKSGMAASKKALCLNNLRQCGAGISAFQQDNGMRYPGDGGTDGYKRWIFVVAPYMGLRARNPNADPSAPSAYVHPVFHCPLTPSSSYNPSGNSYGCYGLNRNIATPLGEIGISGLQVKNPASKVLLAEKSYLAYKGYGGGGVRLETAPFPQNQSGPAANHRLDDDPRNGPDGPCNYLFCDGHAETLDQWPGAKAFAPLDE